MAKKSVGRAVEKGKEGCKRILLLVLAIVIMGAASAQAGDKNNYLVVGHITAINGVDYIHSTVTFTVHTGNPATADPRFICDLDSGDLACFTAIDSLGDCVEIKATLRGDATGGYYFHPTTYSSSASCTPLVI